MRLTPKQARRYGLPEIAQPKTKRPRDDDQGRCKVFDAACRAHGLPVPVREYQFAPPRKWRFDWLFEGWLAVEQSGGVWVAGHHSGGQSQIDDMERRNEAQLLGFLVLEFTPQQFEDGSAFEVIRRALGSEGEQP